eukprot:366347-Chlamydomonas_euryale.AAC.10
MFETFEAHPDKQRGPFEVFVRLRRTFTNTVFRSSPSRTRRGSLPPPPPPPELPSRPPLLSLTGLSLIGIHARRGCGGGGGGGCGGGGGGFGQAWAGRPGSSAGPAADVSCRSAAACVLGWWRGVATPDDASRACGAAAAHVCSRRRPLPSPRRWHLPAAWLQRPQRSALGIVRRARAGADRRASAWRGRIGKHAQPNTEVKPIQRLVLQQTRHWRPARRAVSQRGGSCGSRCPVSRRGSACASMHPVSRRGGCCASPRHVSRCNRRRRRCRIVVARHGGCLVGLVDTRAALSQLRTPSHGSSSKRLLGAC